MSSDFNCGSRPKILRRNRYLRAEARLVDEAFILKWKADRLREGGQGQSADILGRENVDFSAAGWELNSSETTQRALRVC